MPGTSTTLVKRVGSKENLVVLLHDEIAQKQIAPFLGPGDTLDRVTAGMLTAVERDPKLLNCTPTSLLISVAQAVRSGLEIGDTAHIVPFRTNIAPRGQPSVYEDRATFIADYKGIARLMVSTGMVRGVEIRAVYEGDGFHYKQGLSPELGHHPVGDKSQRGRLVGAYCILRFAFGRSQFEYMTVEEIDEIRLKYSKQWKEGPCPPWYAKKTVLRQASKLIPQSPAMSMKFAHVLRALSIDAETEFGAPLEAIATPGTVVDDEDETSAPAAPAGAVAEATDPAAAAAAADGRPVQVYTGAVETPAEPELTLDVAKAMTLGVNARNALHGKPLESIESKALEAFAAWIVGKQVEKADEEWGARSLRAIRMVLADRQRDQTSLFEGAPGDDAGAGTAAAGSGGSVRMPPPGRVSDALTPSGGTPKASAA